MADVTPLVVTAAGAPRPYAAGDSLTGAGGAFVQEVRAEIKTVVTCSTTIPYDDTIPQQSTEGIEILTLSITPTDAANILVIEFQAGVFQGGDFKFALALFQDATEDAIHAVHTNSPVNYTLDRTLRHRMVAGTTSATTFKIRGGDSQGGQNNYVNGSSSGGSTFGGRAYATLTIREVTP